MPTIDMSLPKLREYMGISPRPVDFDKFWDDAIAESVASDKQVEMVKCDIGASYADAYDLYFTGTRGARIHARLLIPKNIEGKVPAVLKFHGLGGWCGAWTRMLPYAAQGMVIAALDCRGQAGYSEDAGGVAGPTLWNPFIRGIEGEPKDLYYRDVFLDVKALTDIVMGFDFVDETRVGCFGGSQGGALAVVCAALTPTIKLCLTQYPYLSDYRRVWEMDLDKGAYEALRVYFRSYDPRHEREDEFFGKLGYIDIQNLAPRIKGEVLMLTGLMDTTCPPSTQFAMYNKITSKKNVMVYHDFGHEEFRDSADVTFQFLAKL